MSRRAGLGRPVVNSDMELGFELPALVKLGLVFIFVLLVYRLKVHLGLSLFLGAALLGVSMGMSAGELGLGLVNSLISSKTLSLALLVITIMVMSRLMADSGQLDRIVAGFSGMAGSDRLVSLAMPALIGLLPMPGGALFSAPMVESACGKSRAEPELKAAINYWFRHIWEYWWPLYPGVLLAVALLKVEAWRFIAIQVPWTVLSVTGGLIFLARGIPSGVTREVSTAEKKGGWAEFMKEALPVIIVVAAFPVVLAVEWVLGLDLPPMTAVFVGLGLSLVVIIRQNRIKASAFAAAVFDRRQAPMVLLIAGIMTFQGLLIESQAVAGIKADMDTYGLPPMLIILAVPFLSGLITGLAVGFVGASFPVVVPLLAGMEPSQYLSYATLAYGFGYMGMMLSPVHLCLLLTRDFFRAELTKSYRHLVGPVLFSLLGGLAYFGLLLWW